MAYVTYPLTGSGDVTAKIPTDLVNDEHYQYLKLADGTPGSTLVIPAKETTPGTTDAGMITRNIPSTGLSQLVTVGNPTTAVTVSNPTTAVTITNPTTSVNVANPTTSVNVANPTTAVTLAAGSSTTMIGAVAQGSPGGSSADAWWVRTVTTGSGGGSTTVDANLSSAGSTKVIGLIDGIPFSSGQITRSTLNSSAEGQIFAANANRKYAAITNLATAVTLYIGLSTAAVTTLGANAHILIAPLATFTMGGMVGNMPNYTGPIRGRVNSTTVAGPVIGVEFS